MVKISVIGANSYIARNFIRYIDKTTSDVELKLYDFQDEQIDGFKNYTSVNLMDCESVKNIDLLCDVIFMFVGKTGGVNGFDKPDDFIKINENMLLHILNEYRFQHSEAKLIFPSTRLVYKGKKHCLKEDSDKEFKTVYAINKYACEKYIEMYHNVFNLKYAILRICVPYGTLIEGASSYGTAEFMLSKATNGENIHIYGDGSVRRTLTHISDLCAVMYKAALNNDVVNDVYNVGGEEYSLADMAKLIAKKYGVSVDYGEWPEVALKIESNDTVFDSSKLDDIIGNLYEHSFVTWIDSNC